MVLGHPAHRRADPVPVEPARRCRDAQCGGIAGGPGEPALPAVRRQHKRLPVMDGCHLAIRGACHDNKPVLVPAAHQQAAHAHHPAIAKLHMPGPFRCRPFIPATCHHKAAARGKGIAEGRFFSRGFHAGIDQEASSLGRRRQPPGGEMRFGLQAALGDDQRGLRRRHIPSWLKIVQHRDAEPAHQLFRRCGAGETSAHA